MTIAAPPATPATPITQSKLSLRQLPWPRLACALLVLLYALFITSRFAPAISQPDDNGYFAQGTLLAQTGHTWFSPASDAQYIGMHWLVTPDEKLISRYPPGLAVLIAAVYTIAGYKAAVFINPALAIATLVGIYALAKRFVGGWWALGAVAAMMFLPSFANHALSGDAHMAVAACVVWGLYFLLRWQESRSLLMIFLAGLILGCIPTIRYPDALIGLGVLAFIGWHLRTTTRPWLHVLIAAVGALVPILPLLIRNQLLLGAFWKTGYALTNEQTGFAWDYFEQHAIDYIRQVQGNGLGLCAALGLVGMTAMTCTKKFRPHGIMFLLIAIPLLLFYMAYYWAPQMNSAMTMRFILPTFAIYIVAAIWTLREFTAHFGSKAATITLPIVLLTIHALWGTRETLQTADQLRYQKGTLAAITAELDKLAGTNDVVVADNHVLQQLDFVRHWKLADLSTMRGGGFGGGRANSRDPDAPSPGQAAKRDWQREKYPGTQLDKQEKFTKDIKTWAGDGKIYYVGTERDQRTIRTTFNITSADIKVAAKVALPEPPPQRTRPGMMGTQRRDTNTSNNNQRDAGGGPGGPQGGPQGGPGPDMGMGGMPPGPMGGMGGDMPPRDQFRDAPPGMGGDFAQRDFPRDNADNTRGNRRGNFGGGNPGAMGNLMPGGRTGGGGMGGMFGGRFAGEKEAYIYEITLK